MEGKSGDCEMPKYIRCGKAFYDLFLDIADPWRRELKRARRQLSRIGA